MMLSGVTAYILAIIFIATLARAAIGFGEALIAMPLLSIFIPVVQAAPFVALAGTFAAAVILFRDWRHVNLRAASMIALAGMVGVAIGVWALGELNDRLVKGILAVVILGFSTWSLFRSHRFKLNTDRLAPVFGFIAGLLTGAYNTGGPPVAIFGTLRRWPAERFRATMQSWGMTGGTWAIACHSWEGNVKSGVLVHFAISVPLILLACFIGRRLTRAIPTERFVRIVHWGLMVIGIYLLISLVMPDPR